MLDLTSTWKQLIADLERERDELRVKVSLGKADARDLFAKVERKLDNLRHRTTQIMGAAQETAANVEEAGKIMVDEIRDGFARVRKLL
jgi:hypothetical protein